MPGIEEIVIGGEAALSVFGRDTDRRTLMKFRVGCSRWISSRVVPLSGDLLPGHHALAIQAPRQTDSASASARRRLAPFPRQALPCMHASILGSVKASFSIIPRAFIEWEK